MKQSRYVQGRDRRGGKSQSFAQPAGQLRDPSRMVNQVRRFQVGKVGEGKGEIGDTLSGNESKGRLGLKVQHHFPDGLPAERLPDFRARRYRLESIDNPRVE